MEYDLGRTRASRTTPPVRCPPSPFCCCFYSGLFFLLLLVLAVVLAAAMVLNTFIMVQVEPINGGNDYIF